MVLFLIASQPFNKKSTISLKLTMGRRRDHLPRGIPAPFAFSVTFSTAMHELTRDSSPHIKAAACVFVMPTRVYHTGTGLVQLDKCLMMHTGLLPVVQSFSFTRH